MSLPPVLESLFSYIEAHSDEFVEDLKEAVAIKSVSAWPKTRKDVISMIKWMEKKLEDIGAKVELRDIGVQTLDDKSTIPLPPVLLATLGEDPAKKTVLVYGHLDVQPAAKSDGWDSEPFVLTRKDGKLIGRGATDDKGPVLGWLHALQSYRGIEVDIPVNVKLIFEGMEESGSVGLDKLVMSLKTTFLKDVDYVVISDSYWLGTTKPCLTYGLRGVCYFFVEVSCAFRDLHSGVFGGTVYEAMADLIYLLDTLVTKEGEIRVDGIMQNVAPLTNAETKLYDSIEFNVSDYKNSIGATRLRHGEDKNKILMHRWRNPSLSIHGIEGAFSEPGAKTVIPSKVIGKFSIRLVPKQTPSKVEELVFKYLEKKWKDRGSPNKMKISVHHSGKPWMCDYKHKNYIAGERATEYVYKVKPDMTREGGSIPITITFEEATGKNVLLLPMGAGDDGAHSQNEKINLKNYIDGTKVLGAYLYEVSLM